jgi:hypothetical protein
MKTSTNDIDYFEGNENEPLDTSEDQQSKVVYLSLNVLAVVT